MGVRRVAATILLFAGVLALAWAAFTVMAGGFVVRFGAFALSSRDPFRPLLAAAVLITASRLLSRRDEFSGALRRLRGTRAQVPARVAGVAAACVLAFSLAWSSRAAGGSDSSCYVLQAEAFAQGHATLSNPVARLLPDAPGAVFAPIGFIPSRSTPSRAVPICSPGLALFMAGAYFLHRDAVFLIVPPTAALLVWLTFLFGRRLDGDVTGAAGAVLLACSPIFLSQAVQPMSDVPAAALWLAALVSVGRRPGVAGLPAVASAKAGVCASLAVLVRPNVGLIVLPLLWLLPDRRALLRFGLAAAPGLAVLLALNVARYGAPLASGYSGMGVLFSLAHVVPNAARYPRWLIETHTPFVLAALLAPWWIRRHPDRARLAIVAAACAALIVATYLAYTVFDDWWYIRFLLPALPVVLVLSLAVVLDRLPARARPLVACVLCLALGSFYLHVARARHAFDLQWLEARFVAAGEYAGRALPPDAVVLSVQESGAVRFHGRRDTIAWDAIPPDALDRTIQQLRAAGAEPYLALEDAEAEPFRRRFAGQRAGALDWPPLRELRGAVRVRFYAIPPP